MRSWLSGNQWPDGGGRWYWLVVESGSGFETSIRRVTRVISDPDRRSTEAGLSNHVHQCENHRGD